MSAARDAIITYLILRKLTTPFKQTDAFKQGLIDEKGVPTEKSKHITTEKDADAYTLLDRLVFKLKRIIDSLPQAAKLVGSYAAAVAILKESIETKSENLALLEEKDVSSDTVALTERWLSIIMKESIPTFEEFSIMENVDNFDSWFAGSQVVHPSGKPMVVYHGTNRNPALDSNMEVRPNSEEIGIHFGTKEQANQRLKDKGMEYAGHEPHRIIPVHLSIKNPLRTPDLGNWDYRTVRTHLMDNAFPEDEKAIQQLQSAKSIRNYLQSKGHDGIVYSNEYEGLTPADSYIPFSGSQVKSVFDTGRYLKEDGEAVGNVVAQVQGLATEPVVTKKRQEEWQKQNAETGRKIGVVTNK